MCQRSRSGELRLTCHVYLSPRAALVTLFFDMDVVRRRRNAAALVEASAPPAQYASSLCSSLRLLPLLSTPPPSASLGLLPLLPSLLTRFLFSFLPSFAPLTPLIIIYFRMDIIFYSISLGLLVSLCAWVACRLSVCMLPGAFVSRYHMIYTI